MKTLILHILMLVALQGCQTLSKPTAIESLPRNEVPMPLYERTQKEGATEVTQAAATVKILGQEGEVIRAQISLAELTPMREILTIYSADFNCKTMLYLPLEGSTSNTVKGPNGAKTVIPLKFVPKWSSVSKGDETVRKAFDAICQEKSPA